MPGLRRCPWSQLEDESWALIGWWRRWKEVGALPYGGSDIMDQPAYVIEAIQHCEEISNQITTEAHEKHRMEIERSSRASKRMQK